MTAIGIQSLLQSIVWCSGRQSIEQGRWKWFRVGKTIKLLSSSHAVPPVLAGAVLVGDVDTSVNEQWTLIRIAAATRPIECVECVAPYFADTGEGWGRRVVGSEDGDQGKITTTQGIRSSPSYSHSFIMLAMTSINSLFLCLSHII